MKIIETYCKQTELTSNSFHSQSCPSCTSLLVVQPSVFESWSSEVDQQADLDSSGFKIVDQLRLMFWCQSFHSFQFDDDFALN